MTKSSNSEIGQIVRFAACLVLGAFCMSAGATDYTWNGGTSGNWEDAAKWSPSTGYPSTAADTAVLPNPQYAEDPAITVTVNGPLAIGALTVGQTGRLGKLTLLFKTGTATNEVAGNLTVNYNGFLSHDGPADLPAHKLVLKVGGNMTIASGGKIDLKAKGYAPTKGPGGRGQGAGAAYGGNATDRYAYGSVFNPLDWGSGGRDAGGGGALRLEVAGTLTVDGTIDADGGNATYYSGTGGSVNIECGALAGSGTVTARNGSAPSNGNGLYPGNGGRIAIRQRTADNFTAFPHTRILAGFDRQTAPGTVYLESRDKSNGVDVYIEGTSGTIGNEATYVTPFPMAADGNDYSIYTNVNLHVGVAASCQLARNQALDEFTLRSVEIVNNGQIRVTSGTDLKIRRAFSVSTSGKVTFLGPDALEFDGAEECTVTGLAKVSGFGLFKIATPGKSILFGTAANDCLAVATNQTLYLKGTAENHVVLNRTGTSGQWPIKVTDGAAVAIEYVSVGNGTAAGGRSLTAISSTDLGNNSYWGFSDPIAPGAAITWTGAASTDFFDAANWNPARLPEGTDVISIPSVASAKYPVLGAGIHVYNRVTIASGASLTLNGATSTTVTNKLTCSGNFAFTSAEPLYLNGDCDFTGGSMTPANGQILVTTAGDRTLDFGSASLPRLKFTKPSGNVSFGAHGFTASLVSCVATVPIEFTFAAGAKYDIASLTLSGVSGDDRLITLKSSSAGTQWRLAVPADGQNISGVTVSDSNASEGATVLAGTKSVQSNCDNWNTIADVAVWSGGGSGDFNVAGNWSTGTVPGPDTMVTISAVEGATVVVTLPADVPVTISSLSVYAGSGGTAKFVANAPVTIADALDIRENGTVEFNCFSEDGDAPNVVTNSVRIRSGGVLSHSGPNITETAKLHLKVLGNMTVDAGGKVDLIRKGYYVGYGPGWVRCGPMHASTCSSYCNNGTLTSAKHVYGCVRRPFEYGSASSDSGANSYGGGAAHLIVASNLVVNGSMNTSGYQSSGFPGSAGSIYLECGVLSGSGTIYAYGIRSSGDPGCQSSSGRIAVKQTATNDVTSFTGTISTANSATTMNGGGTVYYEFADDVPGEGTLILDNAGQKAAGYYIQFNQYVTDATEPFGEIVIRNGAKLQVTNSLPLRVVKGLSLDSTAVLLLTSGDCLEFTGTDDATLTGAKYITLNRFVCTNAVKKIAFGTTLNDALTIPAGGELVLSGSGGECSLVLEPTTAAATWSITVNADASADVKNVAVSNSNASAGAAILAVESEDLGGNSYWSFTSVIVPGETITWTGGASTDWGNGDNWDLGRTPVDTDAIVISTAANQPTLGSGTYLFNSLTVQSGAALTMSGCVTTVTNALTCAGSLVFSGSEALYLTGDCDFTGGSVTATNSTVYISGEGTQSIDFGNCVFAKVTVDKAGSAAEIDFTDHGFKAGVFRCTATNMITMAFAAGETYEFTQCYLNGGGNNRYIRLGSSVTGEKWKLKLSENTQGMSGVRVSDSDASVGATAYAGATGENEGNNVNWDFTSDVASWIGGESGDFTDGANWSGGTAPKAGSVVSIIAGDGESIAVTIPVGTNAAFASLLMMAGDDGSAMLTAKGTIDVSGTVTMGDGGTLALDAYDDDGEAPNRIGGDLTVQSGGMVTHTGPAALENAKLHLAVTGNVVVDEGGAIDVTGKGYSKNNGPGGSGSFESPAYGGRGNCSKACYGSVFCPTNWGSGANGVGSSGGGAVHLVVNGSLTVNGSVSADGGTENGGYSGTGGSVWIECAAISGSGTVSAIEGMGVSPYAGAGGRIAVYQRTATDFTAFPRGRFPTGSYGTSAAGTIYLESASKAKNGADLIIDRGTLNSSLVTDFPMPGDGDAVTALRSINLIVGKHATVKLLRDEADVPQQIKIRSLLLEAATSKLVLNANELIVIDPSVRRDKDWDPSATVDATDLYKQVAGSIRWLFVGGVLFVR